MRIRFYDQGDAGALSELCRRSILTLAAGDYSPAQVAVWAARVPAPEAMHTRNTDGRRVLVAVDAQDAPLGFLSMEQDGHIYMLYRAPEAEASGVAGTLLLAME